MLAHFYELREKYKKELVIAEAKVEVITDLIKEYEATEQQPCEVAENFDEQQQIYQGGLTDGTM